MLSSWWASAARAFSLRRLRRGRSLGGGFGHAGLLRGFSSVPGGDAAHLVHRPAASPKPGGRGPVGRGAGHRTGPGRNV